MTILEPKKNKIIANPFLTGLLLIFFILTLWSVIIYNQVVDLRYSLGGQTDQLQRLKVANADLKNQLYSLTNIQQLNQLAESKGLVKISAPRYFKLDQQWSVVSASQY